MFGYLLVIFIVSNGVHVPQVNYRFTDPNECIEAAEEIMKDRSTPFYAACMPVWLTKIPTSH